jgi:hypothetical protein
MKIMHRYILRYLPIISAIITSSFGREKLWPSLLVEIPVNVFVLNSLMHNLRNYNYGVAKSYCGRIIFEVNQKSFRNLGISYR